MEEWMMCKICVEVGVGARRSCFVRWMVEKFHVEMSRDLWIFGDLPPAFPPNSAGGISRQIWQVGFPATIYSMLTASSLR